MQTAGVQINGKQPWRIPVLLAIGFLLFWGSSVAMIPTVPAQNETSGLDIRYKDRLVMLRRVACGDKLAFNSAGKLISGGQSGNYAACQGMRIRHVSVKDGRLEIAAQRVRLSYDCAGSQFREVTDAAPSDRTSPESGPRQDVSIEIQLPQHADEAKAMEFMEKFFSVSTPGPIQAILSDDPVFHPGNGTSPPIAIYSPDPEYSEEALKARYGGTVVLNVIVGPDGQVHNVRVARAVGKGLDEKAVEKVKQWKFKPALKWGCPVAVEVSIEIEFHR